MKKFKILFVLACVVLFYTLVVHIKSDEISNEQRVAFVEGYKDEDYLVSYYIPNTSFYAINIDQDLSVKSEDEIVELNELSNTEKKVTAIEDTFSVDVNDIFVFDGTKLVKNNLNEKTKPYYQTAIDNVKYLNSMFESGKYDPEYNSELLMIAEEIEIKTDGLMKKSIFKDMVKEKPSEQEIINSLIKVSNMMLVEDENGNNVYDAITYKSIASGFNKNINTSNTLSTSYNLD